MEVMCKSDASWERYSARPGLKWYICLHDMSATPHSDSSVSTWHCSLSEPVTGSRPSLFVLGAVAKGECSHKLGSRRLREKDSTDLNHEY